MEKHNKERMKKNKFPSITIMIPTYNRAEKLERALLSLNKLNYPIKKIEVIVVNDGSTDNTEEVVEKLRKKVKYNLRYFYQQNKRLAAARNLAIKNSKNEIIVSVDDDMIFPKNWLKKLIKPLEDKKIGAVGGPSLAPSFSTLFQRVVDYCMVSSFIGTGGMIGTTKKSLVKYYPRGGNMAVPKKIFDEVGLFDEKFIPSEEIDLDERIEKAGYKLALARTAKVWHLPRTTLKGFLKQIYSRGYMKMQFIKRHKTFELLYILPMLGVIGLLTLTILSFFSSFFAKLLATAILFYLFILIIDSCFAFKKIKNWKVFFLIPIIMFLQHFTYGLGTIIGIFRSKY